jgi:hypothetical protein
MLRVEQDVYSYAYKELYNFLIQSFNSSVSTDTIQCQMIGWLINLEQLEKWELAVGTEVLGENLPQWHIIHHKFHTIWPGIEPGPPRLEADSYGI